MKNMNRFIATVGVVGAVAAGTAEQTAAHPVKATKTCETTVVPNGKKDSCLYSVGATAVRRDTVMVRNFDFTVNGLQEHDTVTTKRITRYRKYGTFVTTHNTRVRTIEAQPHVGGPEVTVAQPPAEQPVQPVNGEPLSDAVCTDDFSGEQQFCSPDQFAAEQNCHAEQGEWTYQKGNPDGTCLIIDVFPPTTSTQPGQGPMAG